MIDERDRGEIRRLASREALAAIRRAGLGGSGSVGGGELATGLIRVGLATGGVTGNHTVTGIAVGDELVSVLASTPGVFAGGTALADLTAEFSITAADTITNNVGFPYAFPLDFGGFPYTFPIQFGTDTTGDQLIVGLGGQELAAQEPGDPESEASPPSG